MSQLLSPSPARNLSSSFRFLISSDDETHHLTCRISQLSIRTIPLPSPVTTIRMGGGPRTYPGGVSKWQWKRMQAKKAKQLLKARLCRERQIYEMRKRAELRAAVSELEKPWEVVERAPKLFSVSADDQLKALADRFQKPGGFDLWSYRDGPQLFHPGHGLPSARFFPKGVVHSIKPYGTSSGASDDLDDGKAAAAAAAALADEGTAAGSARRDKPSTNTSTRTATPTRSRLRGSSRRTRFRFRCNNERGYGDDGVVLENSLSKTSTDNADGSGISRDQFKKFSRGGNFANRAQLPSTEKGPRETPLTRRGRSNGIRGRRGSVSLSAVVSPNRVETYEMNLCPDGRYEFQTNERVYESNAGS